MIRILLKQIWNSRRTNGWVFIELFIIFIAIWLVVDPLYTLLYQTKAFPLGCDSHNVFCANIGIVTQGEDKLDKETTDDERILQNFNTIVELIRSYDGVCAISPITGGFLWSGSYSSSRFFNSADTTKNTDAQFFMFSASSDYFNVFRFKDVQTKRWDNLDSIPYVNNGVLITENLEDILFGKGKGIGKELAHVWKPNVKYKVLGVIENINGRPGEQSLSCVLFMNPPFMYRGSDAESVLEYLNDNSVTVVFRLADGVDEEAFFYKFKYELLPKLSIGNLYISKIKSLEGLYDETLFFTKIPATIRMQIILIVFFMINICLAVFATFWLRVKKRRSEVGLMMVMGSTKFGIRNYFITESLLIFGMAALAGIVIMVQIIYFKGLYSFGYNNLFTSSFGLGWPINNYFAHFTIVTIIVVFIEGITVLFGTWFSAGNAAKILPADALREE